MKENRVAEFVMAIGAAVFLLAVYLAGNYKGMLIERKRWEAKQRGQIIRSDGPDYGLEEYTTEDIDRMLREIKERDGCTCHECKEGEE
jgi:hypothetical protein